MIQSLILTENINNIDVSYLKKGLYLIKIQNNDDFLVKKIMKE